MTRYIELCITIGPGIMPVHVVVPLEASLFMAIPVLSASHVDGGMISDSDEVTRERFIEWAATA